MTRKEHFLNATKGNLRPYSMVFFDCETMVNFSDQYGDFHKLKLGVAKHYVKGRNKQYKLASQITFTKAYEFVAYMHRIGLEHNHTYLISHNLTFDVLAAALLELFPNTGWHLDSFYVKYMTAIFDFTFGGNKITALNSGNYFHASVEQIGNLVGLPKLSIDFDLASDRDLEIYCERDVDIIAKAMLEWIAFIDEHKLGSYKNTLASTAFNAWRQRFLSNSIFVHNDLDALELEGKAYHGGRVSCFRIGYFNSQQYVRVDVNSMYPYIMTDNMFPVSLYNIRDNPTIDDLKDKLECYAVIAEVLVETTEEVYPFYDKHRLLFPPGKFVTALSTPELRYALDHDHIREVLRMAWYQQRPIFDDYVDYFYNLRRKYKQENNAIYSEICKILLNSLYGKFGQRETMLDFIGIATIPIHMIEYNFDKNTRERERWITIAGKTYREQRGGFSYHSYPAIAAHVTAYARMYLYSLICEAGLNNVLYCDTDSLIVAQEGYNNLLAWIDPSKLGALKVEETTSFVAVYAPKHYETEHTIKMKGIRNDAEWISENTYGQLEVSGLDGMIRRGKLNGVYIDTMIKSPTFLTPYLQVDSEGFAHYLPQIERPLESLKPLQIALGQKPRQRATFR